VTTKEINSGITRKIELDAGIQIPAKIHRSNILQAAHHRAQRKNFDHQLGARFVKIPVVSGVIAKSSRRDRSRAAKTRSNPNHSVRALVGMANDRAVLAGLGEDFETPTISPAIATIP